MAVTYGFFNSLNGDRKYNAEQMSDYFRGIVSEGVFQHLDSGLAVTAGTGLTVNVAAGRAIVQNRWMQNDASMELSISAASETYARIDAVVIRLDWSSRAISIAVKTGTPGASPAAPSLTRNSTTYEMALAYVNVAANATSVTVTDKRSDSTVCGWVTVAQSTSGEVDAQLNAMKTGFDGVEYNSPAEAIQTQVADLHEELEIAYSRNHIPYCEVNNGTYNANTCDFTITSGTLIDFKGFIVGHTYRVIVNGTCDGVGERRSPSTAWITGTWIPLADMTPANEGYYADFTFTEGPYVSFQRLDAYSATKIAIYDITEMADNAKAKLKSIVAPAFVYSPEDYLKETDTFATRNVIPDLRLDEWSYNSETGEYTATPVQGVVYNLNMYGLKYGHTYRIFVNGIGGNSGERLNKTMAWKDGVYVAPADYTVVPTGRYFDWTITHSGYLFTVQVNITTGYATKIAVYDITNLKTKAKAALTDLYLPSFAYSDSNEPEDESLKNILVIGDSQTQRTGYVEKLRTLLTSGQSAQKFGQGGTNSITMAMVQGGIPMIVNPFTIPASGAVNIDITNPVNGSAGLLAQQSPAGINTCIIDGIKGVISYSDSHLKFTRSTSGSEKVISRPTQVFTDAMNYKYKILVVWLGTNDSTEIADTDDLVMQLHRIISDMVKWNNADEYIVMGLTSKFYFNDVANANKKLAACFGYHFLDIRDYILQYGLADAGITPTAADTAAIESGEMPPSLLADSVHFNEDGYDVIGEILYKKGVDLGYWY